MTQGPTYYRFRAVLHLWIMEALLPVSITFIIHKYLSSWWSKKTCENEKTIDAPVEQPAKTYTVVLTGGKMSKTLHLVRCLRSFELAEPNVQMKIVVLEQAKFRYSATGFSRCVDHFEIITSPRDSPDAYMDDIYKACKRHNATHFLPVAAPVEAIYDAEIKERLEGLGVAHLHMDQVLCNILDNKHTFGCFLSDSLKLRSPRTHQVTSDNEARMYNKLFQEEKENGKLRRTMILKNLSYDPIHRLDLFQLPCSKVKLDNYLDRIRNDGNPISEQEPWQFQEFLGGGTEYAAMIVVRENHLVTMTCCPSSASQLNYVHVEIPSIRKWLEDFMTGLKKTEHVLTGQICFDFMVLTEDNKQVAYPIECNPRVHTQCSIYNKDDVKALFGSLLLENNDEREQKMISLLERDYGNSTTGGKTNVYWFYNDFFKILPNSWLLNYNDGNDLMERNKILLMDPSYPSARVVLTALIYVPALIISIVAMLPVLTLFLLLPTEDLMGANLTTAEHLFAIYYKAMLFLDRLVYMNDNIEGDFWEYDPIPFIAKNHIQVASRLLASIRSGVEWKKLDFAIGKVVEVGGD